MYDFPEEVDYSQIEKEFEITQDYRDFILHYNKIENIDVQYLVVKANWRLIQQEQDIEQQKMNLIGFVRKYQDTIDDRVKVLVLEALYIQLKQTAPYVRKGDLLEQCNHLVDYAFDIQAETPSIYYALIYAYWFKAQEIRKKDWRKSDYFYSKVINFCGKINDDEHEIYKVRAQIEKVTLHLQFGHPIQIQQSFYALVDKYSTSSNAIIINLLDEMIDYYIYHLVSEDQWFYQAEQSKDFITDLIENKAIQNIILNSMVFERSVPRLLWIAYAYWGEEQEEWYEQYLLRYFSFCISWEESLKGFTDHLKFNNMKDRKIFLEYTKALYQRHTNLEKYRKLFRSERDRRHS